MSKGISCQKIAFIGGGQMAEALIGGLLSAKLCGADGLWATDPIAIRRDHLKKKYGIQVGIKNHEAVKWADVVVLAVKPQILDAVLADVAATLGMRWLYPWLPGRRFVALPMPVVQRRV